MTVSSLFTRSTLRLWLLSVAIGAGLVVFTYVSVQQSLRLGLNDPQLQIAQDTAYQLSKGQSPSSVLPNNVIDESRSLSPFVTIVDGNIKVLATSGKIGNVVPLPPPSSFQDSQKRSSDWFTWQHDNNTLRDAAVIVPYQHLNQKGYVLVARSMAQMENTMERITVLALLTLIGVVVAPAIILLLV